MKYTKVEHKLSPDTLKAIKAALKKHKKSLKEFDKEYLALIKKRKICANHILGWEKYLENHNYNKNGFKVYDSIIK